mgnify:CR=1 FL=1
MNAVKRSYYRSSGKSLTQAARRGTLPPLDNPARPRKQSMPQPSLDTGLDYSFGGMNGGSGSATTTGGSSSGAPSADQIMGWINGGMGAIFQGIGLAAAGQKNADGSLTVTTPKGQTYNVPPGTPAQPGNAGGVPGWVWPAGIIGGLLLLLLVRR